MLKLRILPFILLGVIVIALATISLGIYYGAPIELYTSWPMIILWALIVILTLWQIVRCQTIIIGIHVALGIILLGGLFTHFYGDERTISIGKGEKYTTSLPFNLTLETIDVENYSGTSAAMDFVAVINTDGMRQKVSMNNVGDYKGYRIFLKGINPEQNRVTFTLQYDPVGNLVTYCGYALLAVCMIGFLFIKKTSWRKSMKRFTALGCLIFISQTVFAGNSEKQFEKWFQQLNIYHNDRISPITTFSADFARQVSGSEDNADEMIYGLIFNFSDWKNKPIIKVKSDSMRKKLGIRKGYGSYAQFVDAIASGSLDDSNPQNMTRWEREDYARFETVNMLVNGSLLKLFPVTTDSGIVWYSPNDRMSNQLDEHTWIFIRKSMGYMNELIKTSRFGDAADLVDKIAEYQTQTIGNEIMPSTIEIKVEKFYVKYLRRCFAWAILSIAVGIGLLMMIMLGKYSGSFYLLFHNLLIVVSVLMLIYLSVCLGMRWYISHHVPLSDGFEIMQFMSWLSVLAAVVTSIKKDRIFQMVSAASLTDVGMCLMVASFNGGGASITHLMPVLSSPWLCIHVALMMLSYTLFSIMAVLGICGLIGYSRQGEYLATVCYLLLVPSVIILSFGIFTGAIWANQSWGRYWGWDPKEVWALISFLIYSVPIHVRSIRCFQNPRLMLLYLVLAFASIIFTYFGVNYLLGGLHSYA